MAIPETASAICGAARGEKPRRRKAPRGLLAGAALALSMASVWAQNLPITPSPNAPAGQRTLLDAAQNGVPIAHIAPPSAAGVSRNQYDQFNVNNNGLILNNSSTTTQTQLGGWIGANPQLGPTPARIILNEVVSRNASELRGTLEVAGQRADIVIANPNGILCDGCGFINTGRGTLTTGTPQFGPNGSLTGFDVNRGQITVGASGLNASNIEQLDLIARGLVLEGEVWAQNLNALAGANQVLYASLQNTPQSGSDAAPRFAIDIKNLGGMYANQIYMIATEQGLGVNSTGRIAALQGNLILTANGDLTLKDSYAKQDIAIDAAGNATLTGQTVAEGAVRIGAGGQLAQQGELDAQGHVALSAGSIANSGSIVQRSADTLTLTSAGELENRGTIASAGAVQAQATKITDQAGEWQALGALTLQAGALEFTGSELVAASDLKLIASNGDLSGNGMRATAGGLFTATAQGQITNVAGEWQALGALTLQAGTLAFTGGELIAASDLKLSASNGDLNGNGMYAAAGGLFTATAQGQIANTAGEWLAAGDMTLSASALLNQGGTLLSNARLQLSATQLIDNTNGIAVGAQALDLRSGALTNDGGTLAAIAGSLTLQSGTSSNRGGLISGATGATLNTQALDNTQGVIQSAANLALDTQGRTLNNDGGLLLAADLLTLATGNLSNRSGAIAGGEVALSAATLDNSAAGIIAANDTLNATTHALYNDTGALQAGGALTLDTQGQALTNTNAGATGGIFAGGALTLRVGQIDNHGGILATNGALTLASTATLDNMAGAIQSAGQLALDAGSLDNTHGSIATVTGSSADIAINTGVLTNTAGIIASDRDLTLNAAQLTADGSLSAQRDAHIRLQSDFTQSAASLLGANRLLDFATTGNFTNTSDWSLPGALVLEAANISNTAGARIAAGDTYLQTPGGANGTGTIDNAGRIEGDTIGLSANVLSNTGAIIGGFITTEVGTLNNTGAAAVIASTEGSYLWVKQTLVNRDGATLYSLGDIAIAASSATDASGTLIDHTGAIINDSALIEARGDLYLSALTLSNTRETPVIATETTSVTTETLTKREKYYNCARDYLWGNGYNGFACGGGYGDYHQQWTKTIALADVISDTPDAQGTHKLVYLDNGTPATLYYSSQSTDTAGGTLTVSYWDGYDPNINFDPASEYDPIQGSGSNQLSERSRQITTTVDEDKELNPSAFAPRIISGGAMNLNISDTLTNAYGTISAGTDLILAGASFAEVSAGQYGTLQVINTAAVLNRYVREDIVSTYAWNEDPSLDVRQVTQAPVILAPVAIGQIGGIISAGGALQVYAGALTNTTVGARANPYGNGVATARTGNTPGALQPVTANGATILTQAPSLVLPQSGLFSLHAQPDAQYLVETDPRFTSYKTFIGSDYFLVQLGRDPERSLKRYGDGFTEQQLIGDQILALTGRRYLTGYSDTEVEYQALMDAGV
ncbi:MAG: filamentous hemagglutinin N-terminal domain-containing protein, partial [Betaproteobacteria bacterium]|nr:filamentous hemagglutinin N-terminal domain-containing protein [Betaproteobacteria bacterium]